MRRVRVEIGSLLLRHPSFSATDGAAVSKVVSSYLQQLLQRGGSPDMKSTGVMRLKAPAPGAAGSREGTARTVAQALFRGLRAKDR